jgi:hypothetical protein
MISLIVKVLERHIGGDLVRGRPSSSTAATANITVCAFFTDYVPPHGDPSGGNVVSSAGYVRKWLCAQLTVSRHLTDDPTGRVSRRICVQWSQLSLVWRPCLKSHAYEKFPP